MGSVTANLVQVNRPRGAWSRLITEFLKAKLEDGAVATLQLEAEARAAGLLGAEQPITNPILRRRRPSLARQSPRAIGFDTQDVVEYSN
jgi:hypothetical protein